MHAPVVMRQIGLDAPGGPEVLRLETAPVPAPRPGDVLIKVEAAGVNRPDVMQRMGRYPVPPDASPIIGLEVAGTIAGRGDGVPAARIGERVCALTNGGGYAEFCAVPAVQCLPWPKNYDAAHAAAVPETFFTVWANMFGHGRLTRGETVLIHGGTSGIGTTAIALALAFGAHPIATAGTAEKCAAVEKLGARAINYHAEDFVAAVDRLTSGQGVDVVLDMVAGSYLSRNMTCLRRDGRLVVIASQGGTKDPAFDIRPVIMKRLVITGSTMRPRSTAEKGALAGELREQVWPLLDAGKCAPIVHATFPLAEAAAAHRLMESGTHIGKIVLTVA
ncbi:MAG TPA: NAD(P)H-quinone oxidoreductase [Acetobacteraceae bacterium]|nr:NAD(P)H-quinone oxidoreductase [Acetobacteraceae bacterium]